MTGFRSDDTTAYLYRSADFGATWTPIAAGLPAEGIKVVREDPRRRDLLYVGTDAGVYVSFAAGRSGSRFAPICPRLRSRTSPCIRKRIKILSSTHGRSLFLLDAQPLQSLTEQVAAKTLHLFEPRAASLEFHAPPEVNPHDPGRANLFFRPGKAGDVQIQISDAAGTAVRSWKVPAEAGINEAVWDLRGDSGRAVAPGTYRVSVSSGTARDSSWISIRPVTEQ